ncbi:MAG: hypothetical protein COV74_10925 [Candidatus Omnitrophica bacterium CG11_big_fil_rev_8_21_14_0_20_45_26]|uniref:SHSP domain-containing protein n=1 Tax=Candidatus Abzuiibacterium crystallinum TaxID=1974748 RepID=A0A2H0LL08_9BACT|nr:MAG: hypothetical protein COV74_10925 [Candidatus Omnitrophica bacterium CG11_big_fil_rev_8_21_14_0_20_45_26]PIW63821.1 MAG: hypothetical protein COW12_07885 [Candidatus Omnitrophica bacterium CG12_big_fil_rev_8_21_14_0_65_45_16]
MEQAIEKKKTTPLITSLAVLLAFVAVIQGYFLYHLHQKNQAIEKKMTESYYSQNQNKGVTPQSAVLRAGMMQPTASFLSGRHDQWDPFREMALMQRHMDRMLNHFLNDTWMAGAVPFGRSDFQTISPSAEFEDQGDVWIIRFDMPGLEKDKIELEVKNGFLSVRAEREAQHTSEDKSKGFYTHEIQYGSFARAVPLPSNADESKVEASYDKGVLTVRISKKDDTQASVGKIAVQ